jgi:hypothetical protein
MTQSTPGKLLGVASTTMDHKVRQATGPGVFIRVGYPSRLLGSIFCFAPRGTVAWGSIFPSNSISNLTLFKSNVALELPSFIAPQGVVQHNCQTVCDDDRACDLVAASYVAGVSVPAEEEPKISVACALKLGGIPLSSTGILRAVGFVDTRVVTSTGPDCV